MPGAKKFGAAGSIQFIDEEVNFDFQHGTQVSLIYEGPEADIKAFAAQFALVARAHAYRHEGPVWRVRITGGKDLTGEPDTQVLERWTRRTETVQLDIKSNPKLIATAGSEQTLGRWVKEIKSILKDGNPENPSWPTIEAVPAKQQAKVDLLKLMARGTDAYETSRIVLVQRLVKPLNQLGLSAVRAVPAFYSTAAMVHFNVPAPLLAELPPDGGPKPSNTEWGWMQRDNDEDITPVLDKVEQTRTWAFAAWSTLLYEYVAA